MKKRLQPKTLQRGSRVVCYARDSGGAKQVKSVDDQLTEIQKYCDDNGYILIEPFADRARSGTSLVGRDDLSRMIELCEIEGYADGVILWNFSRLGRDQDDVDDIRKSLRRHGLVVRSIKEPTAEGAVGKLVERVHDFQAEQTSIKISEDTKRGLSHRAQDGYIPGGNKAPRGYKIKRDIISYNRDDSTRIGTWWEVDSELGQLVTLAFKMRAEGRSLNEIMNSPCGILYKTKGGWVTFFRNESYLGYIKCGETKVYNPKTVPPLVDRETFDAVQRLRQAISTRAAGNVLHPKRYNSPSLLSGLAVCIHCGTPIIREVSGAKSTKTGKWISYLCGKKRNSGSWHACEGKQIKADRADRAIVDAVLNQVLTVDRADELIKQVQASYSDNGEILRQEAAARAALSSSEKSISNLLDTIESTGSATAKDRLKERESDRARLQFELSMIMSQRNAAEIEITPEVLSDVLDVWRGEVEAARDQNDIRGLQRYLKHFIVKIELGYFTARLWYTFKINAFANNSVMRLSDVPCRDRLFDNVLFAKALIISWSNQE